MERAAEQIRFCETSAAYERNDMTLAVNIESNRTDIRIKILRMEYVLCFMENSFPDRQYVSTPLYYNGK